MALRVMTCKAGAKNLGHDVIIIAAVSEADGKFGTFTRVLTYLRATKLPAWPDQLKTRKPRLIAGPVVFLEGRT